MSFLNYRVGGRSAATAATVNHAYGGIWNPSASKSIYVMEIHLVKTVGTVDNHALARSTARGTPGSTVTPDADNHDAGQVVPQSGALLDLAAYSVQPTLATPNLLHFNLPAVIGSGLIWTFPEGIRVPAGAGLVIITPPAVIGQPSDISFIWKE